jgi:hypothetical protein
MKRGGEGRIFQVLLTDVLAEAHLEIVVHPGVKGRLDIRMKSSQQELLVTAQRLLLHIRSNSCSQSSQ